MNKRVPTILLTHSLSMRRHFYGDSGVAQLEKIGLLRLNQDDGPLAPDQLVAAAEDADVLIADRMVAGTPELFRRLPRLRAFLRSAVDIRNVDIDAASQQGILVTRTSATFNESVAEIALGYMIDLARGITRSASSYHRGTIPAAAMGSLLFGSTVGIIGFGGIGQRLAETCAAIGMHVIFFDPYRASADERFERVSFEQVLSTSDFVVCLAAASKETDNLMSTQAFSTMRPGAFFLNLSRGELVDEDALEAALRKGWIAGAALDVGRAADQTPTPRIAELPNVIATPHAAGMTPASVMGQASITIRQAAAVARGEIPEGAVNPDRWARRDPVGQRQLFNDAAS